MRTSRAKRAGRTVNRSVSLSTETLALLERRAKRVHGGNLSAAIAEAARLLGMQEARAIVATIHDELYGPLTEQQIAAIDAEERGVRSAKKKRVA